MSTSAAVLIQEDILDTNQFWDEFSDGFELDSSRLFDNNQVDESRNIFQYENLDDSTSFRNQLQNIDTESLSTNALVEHLSKVNPPRLVIKKNRVIEEIRQLWSGVVISVDDQEFSVILEDFTNRENPDESTILSRDEVDDKEQDLVVAGAQFYWSIGYREGANYSKERISIISFRRLPKWTSREIKNAEQLADEYANFFLID